MRKLSGAAVLIIVGVALYFTLVWGYEGLRTISSPSYGLDDVWRSQFIFAIGSRFGLGPIGLIKLAAFFGTLKLAVAASARCTSSTACASSSAASPILKFFEAGLILVVLISYRLGRPGGVVAQRRTGARNDLPVDPRRDRHRAGPGRAQLSARASRLCQDVADSPATRARAPMVLAVPLTAGNRAGSGRASCSRGPAAAISRYVDPSPPAPARAPRCARPPASPSSRSRSSWLVA